MDATRNLLTTCSAENFCALLSLFSIPAPASSETERASLAFEYLIYYRKENPELREKLKTCVRDTSFRYLHLSEQLLLYARACDSPAEVDLMGLVIGVLNALCPHSYTATTETTTPLVRPVEIDNLLSILEEYLKLLDDYTPNEIVDIETIATKNTISGIKRNRSLAASGPADASDPMDFRRVTSKDIEDMVARMEKIAGAVANRRLTLKNARGVVPGPVDYNRSLDKLIERLIAERALLDPTATAANILYPDPQHGHQPNVVGQMARSGSVSRQRRDYLAEVMAGPSLIPDKELFVVGPCLPGLKDHLGSYRCSVVQVDDVIAKNEARLRTAAVVFRRNWQSSGFSYASMSNLRSGNYADMYDETKSGDILLGQQLGTHFRRWLDGALPRR